MPAPLTRPNRDTVTTIKSDGSRPFLFPAETHGRYTRLRRYSALALIAFYLSLPWIKINGYPAAFLDIAGRRFHLFGLTFATQDLWLMFFAISGVGFTLFLVTALFGRIWCGWACPHTVFLDHVYRQIERWIEGDAIERRALHAAPMSASKAAKVATKHGLYVAVSAVITHLFLAYFVSLPEVWSMVRSAPAQHWGAFAFMAISTGLLYFNFAWFREQLCIVICPYGRLQSVLIDSDSLVIGYDTRRGEPRRKIRRSSESPGSANSFSGTRDGAASGSVQTAAEGDCVDCGRCVHVCPTGIDIRQGLQMECIGCTACIDACNDVMTRLNRPKGLIRYDSQASFAGQPRTRWIRPRTILYFVLLLAGASMATWAFSTVKPANFAVTRMTGAPYIVDATTVRNQFMVRLVNKRNEPTAFVLALEGTPSGTHQVGFDSAVEVGPLQEIVRPYILQLPRGDYTGPFHFKVLARDAAGTFTIERQVEFLGPDARLLREEEEERRGRK